MQSCSRIMRERGYCNRILRLHKGGTGTLKIGKTLGVGTALVRGW
jgi:hypothetical protein